MNKWMSAFFNATLFVCQDNAKLRGFGGLRSLKVCEFENLKFIQLEIKHLTNGFSQEKRFEFSPKPI